MSRRSAIIAFLSVFLFVPACAKADKRVTKANYEKIKPGMTRDDVDTLLGNGEDNQGEEGLCSSAGAVGISGGLSSGPSTPALRWVRYGTDYTHIQVCFDRSGRVHVNDYKKEKGLK